MITYSAENVKFPHIKRRETTAWIRRVAATYGKKVGEVGYLFCDDEHILEVNNEYLGHEPSTIVKMMYSMAILLSHWILYVPMPSSSTRTTTRNCIVSSSMVSFTSAGRTTKDQENVNRWRRQRTKP